MITIDTLVVTMPEFARGDVEHWIAQDWVRPATVAEVWSFDEIDVARLHLIRELLQELNLEESALPLVLKLLDQLYDARRRLIRVREALEWGAPFEPRQTLLKALHASLER